MNDDVWSRLSSSRKRTAILDRLPVDVRRRLQDESEIEVDEKEAVTALACRRH